MSIKLKPVKGMSWKIKNGNLILLAINGQYNYIDPNKVAPKSSIKTNKPNEFGNEEVELNVINNIGDANVEWIEGDYILVGSKCNNFEGILFLEKLRIDKSRGSIPLLGEGSLIQFKWKADKAVYMCGVYLNPPSVLDKSTWECKPDPKNSEYIELLKLISSNAQ